MDRKKKSVTHEQEQRTGPDGKPSELNYRGKSLQSGPVKLSFVSLHIPRTSDAFKTLQNVNSETRRLSAGGEIRVVVKGVARDGSLPWVFADEPDSEHEHESEGSQEERGSHCASEFADEDEEGEMGVPAQMRTQGEAAVGVDDKDSGTTDDKSSFSDFADLFDPTPPGSEKTSVNLNNTKPVKAMKSEGREEEENLLSEAETTSSLQFPLKDSVFLRKSVDSVEYAEIHGLHIAGKTKEEDLEFERREPQMTDAEIEDGMKQAYQHNATLLEGECVVREVLLVWEAISKYIICKMKEGFAVRIPGLGTFTKSVIPNNLFEGRKGNQKFHLRRRRNFPVFKISPHVREMCGLTEDNYFYQCNLPVVALSSVAIASETKLSRSLVQGIITETLIAFSRGVTTSKLVEFPFPYIGKLFVKDRKVALFFYRKFCEGLSFDFSIQMSYINSILPGSMTPLFYHRPSQDSSSVFHYKDMNPVTEEIRSRTKPYAEGDLVRDDSEDRCKFMQKLFTHSNLPFDCACCFPTEETMGESKRCSSENYDEAGEDDEAENDTCETPANFLCEFSKNYDRIEQACCMQPGQFSFQQPDGSSFTPEPLYKTAKTGNPVLDRLTDDRCLLNRALSCWIKRDFLQNLGKDQLKKHYDREFFRKEMDKRRKSFLEKPAISPAGPTPSELELERVMTEQAEEQRKSREAEFKKRVEQCLLSLEEEDEGDDLDNLSPSLRDESFGGEDYLEDEGEPSDLRKSRKYKDFEVYSGLVYNLMENQIVGRNESDFNFLSKTPSTSSAGLSPVRTSSGTSVSTPSSPICWEVLAAPTPAADSTSSQANRSSITGTMPQAPAPVSTSPSQGAMPRVSTYGPAP